MEKSNVLPRLNSRVLSPPVKTLDLTVNIGKALLIGTFVKREYYKKTLCSIMFRGVQKIRSINVTTGLLLLVEFTLVTNNLSVNRLGITTDELLRPSGKRGS